MKGELCMSEGISYVLFFLALMGFIIFGVEFAGHAFYNTKANELSEYAIGLAEREGGFTPPVLSEVEKKMESWNMDSKTWKIEYTTGQVNFNEEIKFKVKGEYKYSVFQLWDRELTVKTVPISSARSGVSQVYYKT